MQLAFSILLTVIHATGVSGIIRIVEGDGTLVTIQKSSFFLTCEYMADSSVGYDMTFKVNGKDIDSQYTNVTRMGNTTTVQLYKPSIKLSDAGVYVCSSDSKSTNVTVQVTAEKKFDKSYTFTEEQTIDLTCPVPNSIMSSVQWSRDGVILNDNRMVLTDIDKAKDAQLQLSSIQMTDRGYYTCTVSWNIGKKSYSTLVRVKGKLAPLWPVIGIIAEIIVLALIILFCKDKKKKRS